MTRTNRTRTRWPSWIYAEGQDPDYRFSLANERTFLAWIRTSLALLAAAIAIDVVDLDLSEYGRRTLVCTFITLGPVSAVLAWIRWSLSERAIRRGASLPGFGLALIVVAGVAIVSVVILIESI